MRNGTEINLCPAGPARRPYTLFDVTESAQPDSDAPPYRYTAELASRIESSWQQNWARLGTFNVPNPVGDLAPDGWRRGARRQVVRAGHVPLSIRRRTPRRAPAGLHRHRRLRALLPDERP